MTAAPLRVRWNDAIAAADMKTPVKAVAWRMAMYGNPDGKRIFPGRERLVADCGMSPAAVTRAVRVLRNGGWLMEIRTPRHGVYGGRATEYNLAIPPADRGLTGEPTVQCSPGPERSEIALDGTPDHRPRAHRAPTVGSPEADRGLTGEPLPVVDQEEAPEEELRLAPGATDAARVTSAPSTRPLGQKILIDWCRSQPKDYAQDYRTDVGRAVQVALDGGSGLLDNLPLLTWRRGIDEWIRVDPDTDEPEILLNILLRSWHQRPGDAR